MVFWQGLAKGSDFWAPSRQGVVTGRDGLQAHEKGSDIRAETPKGSYFWAHACQNLERVPAFSEDS